MNNEAQERAPLYDVLLSVVPAASVVLAKTRTDLLWRDNSSGYTTNIYEAGFYDAADFPEYPFCGEDYGKYEPHSVKYVARTRLPSEIPKGSIIERLCEKVVSEQQGRAQAESDVRFLLRTMIGRIRHGDDIERIKALFVQYEVEDDDATQDTRDLRITV